jgi:hypothetical protein
MPRHVQVGVNDFESVAAPGTLGTDSLVTCTGVALVHERRAFILHASGVAMDPKSVIVPFFRLLAKHIPAEVRGQVVPLVAGAGVGRPSRGARGERERADARAGPDGSPSPARGSGVCNRGGTVGGAVPGAVPFRQSGEKVHQTRNKGYAGRGLGPGSRDVSGLRPPDWLLASAGRSRMDGMPLIGGFPDGDGRDDEPEFTAVCERTHDRFVAPQSSSLSPF